jgi:hypothetical protein
MDRQRSRQEGSLTLAILGQAGLAALLGLAAFLIVLSRAAAHGSLSLTRDPAAALSLLLSVSSLLAACSGITAFILLNIERATASETAAGNNPHISGDPRS